MKALSATHQKLGEVIKRLRRENNMTQEDLADKIAVDRSYMGFIERGERNISLEKIIRISKAFNIKLKDLFDF
jgi:transcriptional regulator with XRE-family HTH domain